MRLSQNAPYPIFLDFPRGYFGHATAVCDSGETTSACTSASTIGFAGGTSFASPELAGVITLLKVATGSRQGLLQPALYALAKTQYAAGTNCYATGQASNTGVTTSLPASTCIFHDVTTGNSDNACTPGTPNCFALNASIGILSTSSNSLTVAYPAGAKYDIATGLGSVNVTNLINNFNKAFTSSTALSATPGSITTAQTTTLKAVVTTGNPTGSTGPTPPLTGSVTFKNGTTVLNSCNLNGGTCSIIVSGAALGIGTDSITAIFSGSGTYPSSTSSIVKVTVNSAGPTKVTAQVTATAFVYNRATKTFNTTYTIKNTGASASGPINLSLTGLASGITVANATGTFNGSPYVAVSSGSLAAGASVTVAVQFSDPSNATIAPTPIVYSGAF